MPEFLYNEMKDYMDRIYGLGEDDRIFYFGKGAIKNEIDRISELAQEESLPLFIVFEQNTIFFVFNDTILLHFRKLIAHSAAVNIQIIR